MKIETVQIPANNKAGYVVVNKEDVGTEPVAKWAKGAKAPAVEVEADEAAEPSKDDLMKLTKGDLVAMAENAGISIVPDEESKATIVAKILGE